MRSFRLKYIGLITKKEERLGKQAVVTGALFDVMCHGVLFLFRYPCLLKRPDIRGKDALSQFNEISKEAQ